MESSNKPTTPSEQSAKPTEQPKKERWTLMIFMGASDGVPGFADLSQLAKAALRQMKEVVAGFKPDSKENHYVNTFVQVQSNDTGYRHHLENENDGGPVRKELSAAANGSALTHFIEWAIDTTRKDSKDFHDRLMLVIWGHAYEFTIDPVKTRTGIDSIDFAEVTMVFKNLQDRLKERYSPTLFDPKLDIIGFDSCDLATIEISWQIHEFAHYSLASQIDEPLPGWPYGDILKTMKKAVDRPMTSSDLGTYIVRQYCGKYAGKSEDKNTAVSLTLLNLDRAEEVYTATQALAERLVEASQDPDEVALAVHLFFRSQIWEGRPFVDVADLCLNLWRYSSSPQVADAAAQLGDLLVRPVGADREAQKFQPFVLEHGRNAHSTARLTGVSLYAPHVAPNFDWPQASAQYLKFVFARNTVWGRYVETLAQDT
jgi:hypothetical protein